jgi:chemotaxis protein CheD
MTLHRSAQRTEETEELPQKVHIIQGQYHVSDQPNVVLMTLLGSCVAACIHDPLARVGGMNHFLLPGADRDTNTREAERYGVHLMELLVNGLLQRGARKDRLQAKLFGGARTLERLSDIGRQNSIFAERFLKTEGITYLGGSCGGESGRRLQFWPVSGRARQAMIAGKEVPIVVPPPAPHVDGDVEFF